MRGREKVLKSALILFLSKGVVRKVENHLAADERR